MTGDQNRKRLLIAAESFVDARPAIQIARHLAGVAVSDIGGLLVERALETDTLPSFAQRVVTSSGSLALLPQASRMRQMLESDAKAFQEQLTRLARQFSVGWSFEREPGDPVERFIHASAKWDWLVIGHRRIGSYRGCIVTIQPENQATPDIPSLSDLIARASHARTMSLSASLPAEEILKRLELTCAELVLIDAARGPIRSPEQIRMLLEAARCPVFIIRPPETS
ncbi:hypothetical protein AVO45_04210 [Ruegeria marisrubri]|uniref:UspA domain-containing protein n=1 Tax=Ruegeria marisrubri TaxID=1685379 RepID=A0A124F5S3_9RHOB|nr:hypothetical protein [Ruegeria marisrubri]KUJ86171.1 hypothetical protein AVO45_04210 [Ruegeria marisrubri]